MSADPLIFRPIQVSTKFLTLTHQSIHPNGKGDISTSDVCTNEEAHSEDVAHATTLESLMEN